MQFTRRNLLNLCCGRLMVGTNTRCNLALLKPVLLLARGRDKHKREVEMSRYIWFLRCQPRDEISHETDA
jgi:hypothetical protein